MHKFNRSESTVNAWAIGLTKENTAAMERLEAQAAADSPSEAELHERWIETSNSELTYWSEDAENDQPIAGPSNTSSLHVEAMVPEVTVDLPDIQLSSDELVAPAPVPVSPLRGFARRPTRLNPWE